MKREALRNKRLSFFLAGCLALTGMSAACTKKAQPEDRFSREGMVREAARFIRDARFRRTELESAFTNPTNAYSRERLLHYGLETRGWDLLPEWNPRVSPIAAQIAQGLQRRLPDAALRAPVWNGVTPETWEAWTQLGRKVFFEYPLRSEVVVRFGLENPEIASRYGIRAASDGTYPGLVTFLDEDNRAQYGLTCALCHASVSESGHVLVGEARRDFDFGALRLAHAEKAGVAIEARLASRFRHWGPGRADVTEDDDEDPVAIPDLWGLKVQTTLTQAGTIRHGGPAALMLRQETQLLTSNHQKTRPPRVLAAALALYIYSLTPPKEETAFTAEVQQGKLLFQTHCARCHSSPTGSGDLVSHLAVETDSALALGPARGTGFYRTPALLRLTHAAPYLHHGAVSTLEDLLDPARLTPAFERGTLGKGAIAGHRYGTELPKPDRDVLVAYLKTL
jgi:Cytochrome c